MEEYYYLDASRQRKGPITPDDFVRCGVTADTLVWKNGMTDWRAAGTIPELTSRFTAPPPPPAGPASGAVPGSAPAGAAGMGVPPGMGGMGASYPEAKPDNYLIWSILATVLCCLPLGVVAIVYSAKVDNLWNAGNRIGAIEAAKNAKMYTIISAVFGLIGGVVVFFMSLFGALN